MPLRLWHTSLSRGDSERSSEPRYAPGNTPPAILSGTSSDCLDATWANEREPKRKAHPVGPDEDTRSVTSGEFRCLRCGFELWMPVARLRVSSLGLYDDARFPGRCLLALDEHHEDLATMPGPLAAEFLEDARLAGRAIRAAVVADRVNYAVLGNVVSHVHFHLVPRVIAGDPAPQKAPWESPLLKEPLQQADRKRIMGALQEYIRQC